MFLLVCANQWPYAKSKHKPEQDIVGFKADECCVTHKRLLTIVHVMQKYNKNRRDFLYVVFGVVDVKTL